MRFIDETRVLCKAGDGGRGCVSFLRMRGRRGGPDGGDGGKGGDVVLLATTRASTLLDVQLSRHYRAESGRPGARSTKKGSQGEDVVVQVPMGTVVFDEDTGAVLGDLTRDGQRLVVARGGKGGLGNSNFATPERQAPEYAQPGIPGEERHVRLELKLLADVAIVGLPNAGKSTLIRKISRSQAKVADYPFTTLIPNLGVVAYGERSFVVADVLGLIAGASEGAGLGHRFLRHIERTRVLVHLVDVLGDTPPREAYETIEAELTRYDPELLRRPRVVCLTKTDLVDEEGIAEAAAALRAAGAVDLQTLSPLLGVGIAQLVSRVGALLAEIATAESGAVR